MDNTLLSVRQVQCPYCWETIEVVVDPTQQEDFIEDCSVCCRPIHFRVYCDADGEVDIEALREEDV